jgi:2',3'-cyclic-nucleotide 2'-phosphodiesterase (5'-nucleotidase family)
MPFENELVVLTLKGCDVIDLCESFARYGAQGVAGMRVTIIDGKLADVTVAGKAVNPKADYTIATSDYIAQGGSTYRALKIASESQEPITCDFDYEALVSYLIGPLDHEVPERYREPQGRITIITE